MISDARGASLTTTGSPVGGASVLLHVSHHFGHRRRAGTARLRRTPCRLRAIPLLAWTATAVLMLKANISAHSQAKTPAPATTAMARTTLRRLETTSTTRALAAAVRRTRSPPVRDAVATGDAGCTNSGSGCHGTDATRVSFAVYHPETGCTSGVCHTSPGKADYAGNGDCQSCHDGTFADARCRADLGTQHYNETTHTAS